MAVQNIAWHFLADVLIYWLETTLQCHPWFSVWKREPRQTSLFVCVEGGASICIFLDALNENSHQYEDCKTASIWFEFSKQPANEMWSSQTCYHFITNSDKQGRLWQVIHQQPEPTQAAYITPSLNKLNGQHTCIVLQPCDISSCCDALLIVRSLTDDLAGSRLRWVAASEMVGLIVDGCWLPLIWHSVSLRIHTVALLAWPGEEGCILCACVRQMCLI